MRDQELRRNGDGAVPESAEFDSMPQAAINTGIVDIISPVSDMPGHLLAYAAQISRHGPLSNKSRTSETESAIQKIFMLIRAGLVTTSRITSPARSIGASSVVWR